MPIILTSSNVIDWLRNLESLLKSKHIAYVLEEDGLVELASDVSKDLLLSLLSPTCLSSPLFFSLIKIVVSFLFSEM